MIAITKALNKECFNNSYCQSSSIGRALHLSEDVAGSIPVFGSILNRRIVLILAQFCLR